MACHVWFVEWMSYHQELHPHHEWADPYTDEGQRYFQGWMGAIDERGVARDELEAASRRLQADPPGHPNRHLKALLVAAAAVRRDWADHEVRKPADAPDAAQLEASLESADCPECDGSGWARRWFAWHSLPRPFPVSLFCRCPHGRWREAKDPDRVARPDDRNFDDLQAWPSLWDASLAHRTWSQVPRPRRGPMPDRRWRYLLPGEPVPAAAPPVVRPEEIAKPVPRRGSGAAVQEVGR